MRIGIDARTLTEKRTGIGNYLMETLRRMHERSNHEFFLFSDAALDLQAQELGNVVIGGVHSWLPRKLAVPMWVNRVLPEMSQNSGVDVLWGPNYVCPTGLTCPTVVTVHDLATFEFPRGSALGYRLYLNVSLRRVLKSVSAVLVVSESTKSDLVGRRLGVTPELVTVTPLGPTIHPTNVSKGLSVKAHARGRYILSVGTVDRRKNINNLILAYNELLQRGVARDYSLIICGRVGQNAQELKTIRRLGLENHVHIIGYVTHEELVHLYTHASIFAYPSFYEGFGIPVLDAMVMGKAIYTSNTSSLPEVVGDAAALVNPHDLNDMTRGLERLITDEGLAQELGQRAQIRSRSFSWEKTAELTLETLERAVSDEGQF